MTGKIISTPPIYDQPGSVLPWNKRKTRRLLSRKWLDEAPFADYEQQPAIMAS
ncbi:MAG: hypothetical protein P9M08_01665 [Candidatus Erginobacter occultus]|nr:hypothetical protein [Candidatus Erginobacter occultus]